MESHTGPGRGLRLACLQLKARGVEEADIALKEALEMIDRAAEMKPDLMLLPECTYPAYMLKGWGRGPDDLESAGKARRAFAGKAAEHRCHVAVGLVEIDPTSRQDSPLVYNSAYLFSPDGALIGKTRKHFLWHFDSRWFMPGDELPVFDTPWGRIGMLVCADARLPEVARVLALKGARLILDLTNWTSTGRNPATLTNPQVDYMLRTRALENRVWIAAADKCGVEQDSVVYCGSSCVVAPDGEIVSRASSDSTEILVADIDFDRYDRNGGDGRRCFSGHEPERRPEEYGVLSLEPEALGLPELLNEAVVPRKTTVSGAVVQVGVRGTVLESLARRLELISQLDVSLAVFPEPSEPEGLFEPENFKDAVRLASEATQRDEDLVVLLTGYEEEDGRLHKCCVVVSDGSIVGRYRKAHLERHERGIVARGDSGLTVFETRAGRIGVMLGCEGLIPEVARVLTLKGADVIAWPGCLDGGFHWYVARTRAAENRVYVLFANAPDVGSGESLMVDPAGTVIGEAFSKREQVVSALCNLSMARSKAVVPGTDVVFGRRPWAYRFLTEQHAES